MGPASGTGVIPRSSIEYAYPSRALASVVDNTRIRSIASALLVTSGPPEQRRGVSISAQVDRLDRAVEVGVRRIRDDDARRVGIGSGPTGSGQSAVPAPGSSSGHDRAIANDTTPVGGATLNNASVSHSSENPRRIQPNPRCRFTRIVPSSSNSPGCVAVARGAWRFKYACYRTPAVLPGAYRQCGCCVLRASLQRLDLPDLSDRERRGVRIVVPCRSPRHGGPAEDRRMPRRRGSASAAVDGRSGQGSVSVKPCGSQTSLPPSSCCHGRRRASDSRGGRVETGATMRRTASSTSR